MPIFFYFCVYKFYFCVYINKKFQAKCLLLFSKTGRVFYDNLGCKNSSFDKLTINFDTLILFLFANSVMILYSGSLTRMSILLFLFKNLYSSNTLFLIFIPPKTKIKRAKYKFSPLKTGHESVMILPVHKEV